MTTPTTPDKSAPEKGMELLPDEWPMQGPAFNAWYKDLPKFAAILEKAGAFWTMDWPLKYLSLWTDTRDGAFLIFDRDKNKIDAKRVLTAIKKWDNETGEYTKNTRANQRASEVEGLDEALEFFKYRVLLGDVTGDQKNLFEALKEAARRYARQSSGRGEGCKTCGGGGYVAVGSPPTEAGDCPTCNVPPPASGAAEILRDAKRIITQLKLVAGNCGQPVDQLINRIEAALGGKVE